MKRPDTLVKSVVFVVALVYSITIYLSGSELDSAIIKILSFLPTLAVMLLILWDYLALKLPIVRKFMNRPRFDGLWKFSLTPTAESHIPEGGNKGPIPGYMIVKQTFWSLHVTQFTEESASESIAYTWRRSEEGGPVKLSYIYRNKPKAKHLSRSHPSDGSSSIEFRSMSPKVLESTYFTDRYTQGDIELAFLTRDSEFGSYKECIEAENRQSTV